MLYGNLTKGNDVVKDWRFDGETNYRWVTQDGDKSRSSPSTRQRLHSDYEDDDDDNLTINGPWSSNM